MELQCPDEACGRIKRCLMSHFRFGIACGVEVLCSSLTVSSLPSNVTNGMEHGSKYPSPSLLKKFWCMTLFGAVCPY